MINDYIYLKFGFVPTLTTQVLCDNCNNSLNAGPNYQPKFCPECGAKVPDLSNVEWKNEHVPYIDYIEYIFENEPDYIILKLKDWSYNDYPVPCVVGKDMEECIKNIHRINFSPGEKRDINITEADLVSATKAEMIEYAKHCGMHAQFLV